MVLKRIVAMALTAVFFCMSFSVSVSAETTHSLIDVGVSPAYEIAYTATSRLSISGQTAYCTSETDGENVVSIAVEQTLEKYSGWLWIWNDIANWTKTINQSTISVSHTQSGLSSGTYRLKSVFTLTDSNGESETITIYSNEKTVA